MELRKAVNAALKIMQNNADCGCLDSEVDVMFQAALVAAYKGQDRVPRYQLYDDANNKILDALRKATKRCCRIIKTTRNKQDIYEYLCNVCWRFSF